ncbi:hypothetical protein PPYR_04956 [Photinus pyralis]|uniref:ER membrane protein complex subunit 10 n=1 Tax=Photinus pyralis TaxID=7054 RepID=A0A1Y1KLK2_PHOPY|nr:ER membrane protein complex subunit 10 [Photinus pyralis]KAB0802770.1 hypothetical protein PPYR_04956 [Photinus pyralis]
MYLNFVILSALINFSVLAFSSNIEYDGWVHINLQHSLTFTENPVFTERGNVTIQSLRTGTSVVQQKPLAQSDKVKLRDLAATNKFYQLKSIVTLADGSQVSFLSTVKACMLVESELNDILSVSLDYSGRVITVTLAVPSTSTCEGAVVPIDKLKEFSTNVFVRHTENGPSPDTATYIHKLEREREAKERGDVKDNRSFLAKYWMYIIPVIIIMVISSATNPDGAGAAAAR